MLPDAERSSYGPPMLTPLTRLSELRNTKGLTCLFSKMRATR